MPPTAFAEVIWIHHRPGWIGSFYTLYTIKLKAWVAINSKYFFKVPIALYLRRYFEIIPQINLHWNFIFNFSTSWKSLIQGTPILSQTFGIFILVLFAEIILSSFVTTVAFSCMECAIIHGSANERCLVLSTKYLCLGSNEYIFFKHFKTSSFVFLIGILLSLNHLERSSSVLTISS